MIAAAAQLRSINQPSDRALLRAAAHGGGEANLQKRGLAAARRAHDGQQASALNSASHPMQNPPASCAVAVPRNVAEAQTCPVRPACHPDDWPRQSSWSPAARWTWQIQDHPALVDLDLEILDGLTQVCTSDNTSNPRCLKRGW